MRRASGLAGQGSQLETGISFQEHVVKLGANAKTVMTQLLTSTKVDSKFGLLTKCQAGSVSCLESWKNITW